MILKNCTLFDMAAIEGEQRDLRIENGKITLVAPSIEPAAGEEVIDAAGRIVTPGFIDTTSCVGIQNQMYRFDGNDSNEVGGNTIMPHLRGLDAINTQDTGFRQCRAGGITTAITGPGTALIMGGTCCAFKTGGSTWNGRVLQEEVALRVCLSNDARHPSGPVYTTMQVPGTRMGTVALARDAFMKAKEYHRVQKTGGKQAMDMKSASLARAFDGMLVKFVVTEKQDIQAAIRMAKEFELPNYAIEIGYGVSEMVEEFKASGAKLLLGNPYGGVKDRKTRNRRYEQANELAAEGIDFALALGHPGNNGSLANVNLCWVHKGGLATLECLKSVTVYAAEAMGLQDRIGTLEAGKDADIVVWDGNPMDYYGKPEIMLINGEQVSAELYVD